MKTKALDYLTSHNADVINKGKVDNVWIVENDLYIIEQHSDHSNIDYGGADSDPP